VSDHLKTGEEPGASQRLAGQHVLDDLYRQIVRYNPNFDRDLVQRAFHVAVSQHHNQFRASGEDYILHPLGTATICADLRLDSATVAAALLHDVVEDTDVGVDAIRQEFGEEVALLVDGVTKLTQMSFKSIEEQQAENFRKMIIAMAKDIRVILIKLADRLHNMRTLC
jgi:guanosine-3',5'-bis(diphosphate) 3'-pyrophosphohydrolase